MSKVQHQWAQHDGVVVITYPIKSLQRSNVDVEFADSSCSVTVALPTGADAYFDFDPLFGEIDPTLSSFEVYYDKLEITLAKKDPSSSWKTLVADDVDDSGTAEASCTPLLDGVPFQIMSDLHLEFHFNNPHGPGSIPGYDFFDFPAIAPNLALLGDIGLTVHDGLFSFLERQVARFENVFFVMGNHEGYGSDYDTASARLREFEDAIRHRGAPGGAFVFLDQTRHDLTPALTLLGCTLRTAVPPAAAPAVARGVSDFVQVRNWTLAAHTAAHAADAAWLASQCAQIAATEPGRRVAVLTHHAPVVGATSRPAHRGGALASAYATEMSGAAYWGAPVRAWASGHTHWSYDFVKDGVRVVSNQRGYEGSDSKASGFDACKVVYL